MSVVEDWHVPYYTPCLPRNFDQTWRAFYHFQSQAVRKQTCDFDSVLQARCGKRCLILQSLLWGRRQSAKSRKITVPIPSAMLLGSDRASRGSSFCFGTCAIYIYIYIYVYMYICIYVYVYKLHLAFAFTHMHAFQKNIYIYTSIQVTSLFRFVFHF